MSATEAKLQKEEIADVLERALELMNDEGKHWLKGEYKGMATDGKHNFCSAGAIMEATETASSVDPVNIAIFTQLARDLPDAPVPHSSDPLDRIVTFNDNESTTWQDVVSVFRKAVARLRGK